MNLKKIEELRHIIDIDFMYSMEVYRSYIKVDEIKELKEILLKKHNEIVNKLITEIEKNMRLTHTK